MPNSLSNTALPDNPLAQISRPQVSRPAKTRARVNLAATAQRLADQDALWRSLVEFNPVSRHYERLVAESDYEAWLLTWLPGQGTDWHDHGGSAGAFTVVQGTLAERTATVGNQDLPTIDSEPRVLSLGALRAFGTRHLHKVTNDGIEPAVSVHVYAPALTEMNTYRPDGLTLRLASSELVGADW